MLSELFRVDVSLYFLLRQTQDILNMKIGNGLLEKLKKSSFRVFLCEKMMNYLTWKTEPTRLLSRLNQSLSILFFGGGLNGLINLIYKYTLKKLNVL
jgi:hypothetical protein